MAKRSKTTEIERPLSAQEKILSDAMEQVRSKAEEHGDTLPSFQMIAEFWSVYVKHAHRIRPESWIEPTDVAQMMSLLKIARSVYGDNINDENYVDGAGYTSLAALLKDAGVEDEDDAV